MAQPFTDRMARVRSAMRDQGVDALLLSVGPDLPWLTGYEAMPLERLTMLVVTDQAASLIVPRLEAPRVVERDDLFRVVPWGETDDPIALVAERLGAARRIAIGERTWSRFVLDLQHAIERTVPGAVWSHAGTVCGPLRERKDAAEVAALQAAGAALDHVTGALLSGEVPLIGRTEADVAAELSRRILDVGHHRVNFAIVAAGANAASPHHEPGSRRIEPGEAVLVDIGGTMLDAWGVGYCSDMTRCLWTGPVPEPAQTIYDVLLDAHAAALAAVAPGVACQDVDAAARSVINDAGYGEWFVHRTGHGMGVEEHEDPYIVDGNLQPVEVGHCFSIEPGIYLPGRFGFRLEDCVIVTTDGAAPLTCARSDLVSLEV